MKRIISCILASILFLENMPIDVLANEIQENKEETNHVVEQEVVKEEVKEEEILVEEPELPKEEKLEKEEIPTLYLQSATDIAYPVIGGYIYFDESTGTVTGCDKTVTKAVIPNEISGISVTNIGAEAFRDCSSLTNITIPEGVTSIGNIAFYGCSSLTSITIPERVTSIGDYAFSGCSSLTSITIPEGVTSIEGCAFYGCSSLTSITIPNSVTSIGQSAFERCTSLTSITIPEGVTSIGNKTFYWCTSLTSITIPEGVTSIGDSAFEGCSSLTSITIPEGVTSIGNIAFLGCTSLTSITIPNSVTSIGYRAFERCTSLTSITIPEGVTSIGNNTFYWCTSLTSITIPEGVTSIANEAFRDCTSLEWVAIPKSLTSIKYAAFSSCDKLKDVYYSGSEFEWKKVFIDSRNEALNGIVHFNSLSPEEMKNVQLIDRVKEYTSDVLYKQWDVITNSDLSELEKFNKYNELFNNYGFSDIKEGIKYLSNTTDKRSAFLYLTTNEIYTANNFEYMLNNTNKGKYVMRPILVTSGLVFNNEFSEWTDPIKLAQMQTPGITKYKDMLYDFMATTEDKFEVIDSIQALTDMASKVNGGANLYAKNFIQNLNNCETIEEVDALLESKEGQGVLAELSSGVDKNGKQVFTFELDDSSGFGKFSKAMGKGAKTISFSKTMFDDVMDFLTLDSKLKTYYEYKEFLKDIIQAEDELPLELRCAASQVLNAMEVEYLEPIKNICLDILNETEITPNVIEEICNKFGCTSFNQYLVVVKVTSFFINQVTDVGHMIKKEAFVEGYSYLGNYYKNKLIACKNRFVNNPTEDNAWNFYYNYNLLYNLRHKGEEAYLAMTKVEGLASKLFENGYQVKKDVVADTLNHLETKCKFTLEGQVAIAESKQYQMKTVVRCPVDISIYTVEGTLVATLKNGKLSDVTNEHGRFMVIYNSFTGEYEKVMCFNQETNYKFNVIGEDKGLMSLDMAVKSNPNTIYQMNNIKFDKNTKIDTSVNEIINDKKYGIDIDGDGVVDLKEKIDEVSDKIIKATDITLTESELEMFKGDTSVINVNFKPVDVTEKSVVWISSNTNVVDIVEGKVTAINEGKATIFCIPLSNPDLMKSCEINVKIKHVHSGKKVEGKPATYYEPGIKTYYECSCGKKFEDKDCTKEISDFDKWKVIPIKEKDYQYVIEKINSLGTITLESKKSIEEARKAYDGLSKEAKSKVTNLNVLEAAEKEYARLVAENEVNKEAKAVEDKISAIGKVSLDSKKSIEEARKAYDGLSKEAKSKVTNLNVLEAAEKEYARLVTENEVKTGAKAVEDKISAIGKVSLDSKKSIEEARKAYDGLSKEAKSKVTNLNVLEAAEKEYARLVAENEKDSYKPSDNIKPNLLLNNQDNNHSENNSTGVMTSVSSWLSLAGLSAALGSILFFKKRNKK